MKLKNIKRFSFILTLILVLTMVGGCTTKDSEELNVKETSATESADFPKTIKDGFENEITLEKSPEKIVSLAPNNTEILFALGLDDQIVGVSTADDYPEEASEKEQVGGYEGNNLEKIIEIETDLVLSYGEMDDEELDRLKEADIPVLAYMPESIDETIEAIKEIGNATGTEEKAKEITDNMIEKRDEIVGKVKDAEKKKVFYEVGYDPLFTAGPGSFMNEIIELSNGENIAADIDQAYSQYDLEELVEKDPEIYISPDGDPDLTIEAIKDRPGYDDIDAIKNNNIYIVDANETSRPGPRIVDGLEIIAKAIHPELFE